MPRTTLLIAWFILFSSSIGCALGGNVAHSDSLHADQRQTDYSKQDVSGQLSLDELKPGQKVRVFASMSAPKQDAENVNSEQTASVEMFFALDKVTGRVVSADSDQIVLRDVVIMSERPVDSGFLKYVAAPLLFGPSGGVLMKSHYTEVPGDLSLSRPMIRSIQEMSETEAAQLEADVSDVRPKYVAVDFSVGS
ncbi:MAG: hypothetical protein JNM43_18875 [Planctomycetaceae bacterium]|nr:hypothetical protein [Planctomycetaceae bacterium]